MTYVAKDLKLYVTKPVANRAITQITEWTKTTEDNLKSGMPLVHWSSKPKDNHSFEDTILILRHILSKNGMLCLQERPVSDLFSMQRYMQYLEQSNLLQYILQDLTDKEIRNLQSLAQRAEKLSKTQELGSLSIPKEVMEKAAEILNNDVNDIRILTIND